jgi:hypothetical protein
VDARVKEEVPRPASGREARTTPSSRCCGPSKMRLWRGWSCSSQSGVKSGVRRTPNARMQAGFAGTGCYLRKEAYPPQGSAWAVTSQRSDAQLVARGHGAGKENIRAGVLMRPERHRQALQHPPNYCLWALLWEPLQLLLSPGIVSQHARGEQRASGREKRDTHKSYLADKIQALKK